MTNNANIPLLLQIMDNMLIQVNGRKRVVLYSPKDAVYLYLNGESGAQRASDTAKDSQILATFV